MGNDRKTERFRSLQNLNCCRKRSFSRLLIVGVALILGGCQTASEPPEPLLTCPLPTRQISALPSAFPPLSPRERQEEWAKELFMGDMFAKECDFYRAITCYKRALIVLPPIEIKRHAQIDYDLMLCYYFGGKYQEVIHLFEASDLSQATPDFPSFNHLLLVVYECYLQIKQQGRAQCLLDIIRKFSPETADDLLLYETLKRGDIDCARSLISQHREREAMEKEVAFYDQRAKSSEKARLLNALLPGAGYYYVGQRRSALTSFLINTLFTAAAYQFFHRGYPAAGAITASLEAGWYLGGINGAGIEAQEFNTRLYEGISRKILTDHACFPLLMFETSF